MENIIESNDENNFSGIFREIIALYEATCAKVNTISNNKSEEKHNPEESTESCKITPTKVKGENDNSKEEHSSVMESIELSTNTSLTVQEEDIDIKEQHNYALSKVQEEDIDIKEEHNCVMSKESSVNTSLTVTESQDGCDVSMEIFEVTSARNGAKIIFATDDCYGVAENLLKDDEPICNEHAIFDNDTNNNVDGWKTQKIRTKQHNFVIIQLADRSDIHVICIDTACFINSYTANFSVQGGVIYKKNLTEKTQSRKNKLGGSSTIPEYLYMQNQTEEWDYLIPTQELNHGYPSIRKKIFKVLHDPVTHLRLNIFPDGGIARLRAYGKVLPVTRVVTTDEGDKIAMTKEINLLSSLYNSHCVSFSEIYIGHPNNIIQPNKGTSIIDGWVTRKQDHFEFKKMLFDQIWPESWATFQLGRSGIVTRVVIDTRFFTGNAPYKVRVQGFFKQNDLNIWRNIIPEIEVKAGTEQIVNVEKTRKFSVTNVKIILKPDGGISRFRVFGIPNN